MGPFDRPVRGTFERMFDFDGDGTLDPVYSSTVAVYYIEDNS